MTESINTRDCVDRDRDRAVDQVRKKFYFRDRERLLNELKSIKLSISDQMRLIDASVINTSQVIITSRVFVLPFPFLF